MCDDRGVAQTLSGVHESQKCFFDLALDDLEGVLNCRLGDSLTRGLDSTAGASAFLAAFFIVTRASASCIANRCFSLINETHCVSLLFNAAMNDQER